MQKINITQKSFLKKIIIFFCLFSALIFCFTVVDFGFGGKGIVCAKSAEDPMANAVEETSFVEQLNPKQLIKNKISNVGYDMIAGGLNILRKLAAIILSAAVHTLNIMLDGRIYEQVFFSPEARFAINTGWGLVRDFVNMFYILILLFLAIATILRVNKFSDKKLIVGLVLSALLVNFSMPITLAVIDASNLAMNFFARQLSDPSLNFGLLVLDRIELSQSFTQNMFKDGDGALLAAFFEFIFTMVLAITIFVLAISLVFRLIAFWVLIILSPLAFFGLALPGTVLSTLWSGWLSKLTNWAFFGPVLLFFLWLSVVLIVALHESKAMSSIAGMNSSPGSTGDGNGTFVVNVLKNSIPFIASIYLLFYGFNVARQMANKAGDSVGGLFSKGQGWLNKTAKYSALAGTGVGGLAAYGGYKVGQRQAEKVGAYYRGKKKALFGDKDERKGNEEEIEAKSAGGEYEKEFNRKKVTEKIREWKDQGDPNSEELARIDRSGTKVEKMARAMHLAEKGKFNTAEDFRNAMGAMGDDKVSAGKLRALAEKKNLNSVMEYDIEAAESAINSGDDQLVQQEIDSNPVVKEMIRAEEERKGGVEMSHADRKTHLSSLNSKHHFRKQAYENKLRTMGKQAVAEQDISFHKNTLVQSTLREEIANSKDPDSKREDYRKFASNDKNMSAAKVKVWEDAKIL